MLEIRLIINIYTNLIVSKTLVIEGGLRSSPRKFLVIFIQNSVILGKINGYMCMVICHKKRECWPF